jgi:hypothetical protein
MGSRFRGNDGMNEKESMSLGEENGLPLGKKLFRGFFQSPKAKTI